MSNADFLINYESNVGTITMIEFKRKNIPKGLKKPYEYIVPAASIVVCAKSLKSYLKPLEASKYIRYGLVTSKPITRGVKFSVYLLGFGFDGTSGLSEKQWNGVTNDVENMLQDVLGEDAKMYIEPYKVNDKFDARFEAYVMFEELNV